MNDRNLFLLLAALYAGLFATGGWLVMSRGRRQLWRNRMTSAFAATWNQFDFLSCNFVANTGKLLTRLGSGARTCMWIIRRRKGIAAIVLGLLVVPSLLALYFFPHEPLEAYVDELDSADPVVTALLQGEHLVPPPPLPPNVFLAKELDVIRPEIANASREWAELDSDFRQRLLVVYQLMARHGYQLALLEGYRSPERQTQLAKLAAHVTNAGAFQSFHQYGLAADSAFYRNGKIVISEKDAWAMEGYRLYGKYAESAGLVWGGRWQMLDFGHVELRKSGVLGRRQ